MKVPYPRDKITVLMHIAHKKLGECSLDSKYIQIQRILDAAVQISTIFEFLGPYFTKIDQSERKAKC